MKKRLLLLFKLFVVACFCISPVSGQTLSNGSFENDLSSWSHQETNGGAAAYAINKTDTVVHSGTNSCKVSVNATGSKINSVEMTQEGINISQDSLHVLHFWARSSVDMAEMYAALVDGDDTVKCHYKIRVGSGGKEGWHQYWFPFKSKSTSLKLKFFFSSVSDYYLDDIEILDQSNGVIDVYTFYMWHYNRSGYGWFNADNDISVKLPDGRVAWFFNDSFFGTNDPYDNVFKGGTFVRNSMVIQEKDNKLTTRPIAPGNNAYFMPVDPDPRPGYTTLYWVGDGFIEGGKLKIILIEVSYPSGGSAAGTGRHYLASFSLPDLTLESIDLMPSYAYTYECMLDDGEYNYIYSWTTKGFDSFTKVARARKGDFMGAKTPWTFYSKNKEWVADPSKADTITRYGASGVRKIGENNYAMAIESPLSGKIEVSFAPTPVGPWTTSKLLYSIPQEVNYWTYMPNIHEDSFHPGKYLISYSVNCYEAWGPSFADKFFYLPRYIQADLLNMSPFTYGDTKNIALNRPVTVSSSSPGANITDGNTSTQWKTMSADPQWAYVDLGDNYELYRVRINYDGSSYPSDLQVQVSQNKVLWTTIKNITGNTSADVDLIDLNAQGRYVRVYMSSRASSGGYVINELEVYKKKTNPVNAGQTYKLVARHSGKIAQVKGQIADEASIEQGTFTGNDNQLWTISSLGEGYYKISTVTGDKVLEVSSGAMDNGGSVELGTYSNQPYQQWSLDTVSDGYFKLINRNSGKALTVTGGSAENGALLRQWDYLDVTNQEWLLAYVNSGPSAVSDINSSTGIFLYPNPVTDILYVNGLKDNCQLEVYNTMGVKVINIHGKSIDVRDLIPGTYTLRIITGSSVQSKLFLKR